MINVNLEKGGDTAVAYVTSEQILIDVTSATGIGGMVVTMSAGQWPDEVIVRLRLRGLESLELAYGPTTIQTGVSSTGDPGPGLMIAVTQPNGNVHRVSPSSEVYQPAIKKNAAEDYFEVALPNHFFQEDYQSFKVRWVDFYR